MKGPRFSVVVPTRERARTLRFTLQTCLEQDFDDYEIVVCDNHSSPATREVVEEMASPRVRYVRADRPLGMSANWELAYSQTRGEFVTYLGDDDGLMPYALRELDAMLRGRDVRAIRWQRAIYTWPCVAVAEDANLLRIPFSRSLKERDSAEAIGRVARFEIGADELPMIYSGVVRREVLEELKQRTGRVFLNWCPDVYSGFAIAHVAGRFLSSTAPLSVAGLSGASNGVAALATKADNRIAEEFYRLSRADGYPPHPRVPNVSVWPVTTADSFLYAKDALFPNDDSLTMDRKDLAERTLKAVLATDPEARATIRGRVRDSLLDEPALVEWFDREAPDPPPAEGRVFGTVVRGLVGDVLSLDAARFGIQTIADAVRFTADLLGLRSGPIRFDMESHASLQQQFWQAEQDRDVALAERKQARDIANAAENQYHQTVRLVRSLEAHCKLLERMHREALEEGALRNVPRRLMGMVRAKLLGLVRRPSGSRSD